MRLRVDLDTKGRIILHGLGRLEPHHAKRALWVRDTCDRLLRMQLDALKRGIQPSVRKLLAHGKIVIRGGRYVLP